MFEFFFLDGNIQIPLGYKLPLSYNKEGEKRPIKRDKRWLSAEWKLY